MLNFKKVEVHQLQVQYYNARNFKQTTDQTTYDCTKHLQIHSTLCTQIQNWFYSKNDIKVMLQDFRNIDCTK